MITPDLRGAPGGGSQAPKDSEDCSITKVIVKDIAGMVQSHPLHSLLASDWRQPLSVFALLLQLNPTSGCVSARQSLEYKTPAYTSSLRLKSSALPTAHSAEAGCPLPVLFIDKKRMLEASESVLLVSLHKRSQD